MIIEQIGDDFGVTVRYEVDGASVKFFAAEVTGVQEDGTKFYWRKGADSSMGDTSDFNDAERYIDGMVKWDGCSHYNFGDENGYLHLCGAADIEKLGNVVETIYERCGELMKEQETYLQEGEFAVS